MSADSILLQPTSFGAIPVANRVVMAPLTRCRAGAGNVPTDLMVEYYRQRASVGLIISEASQIMPEGQGYPSTPGIHSDEQIAGWRKITDAVHQAGGKMVLQLWHVGRVSHSEFQPNQALPVAPSAMAIPGEGYTPSGAKKPYETPRALETAEIPGIVAAYVQGAKNAMAAGFDGVEIHGANGYLLDQFLRDGSNKRTDQYGGSLENRARLLMEVVDAVTAAVGAERTGLRISPLQPANGMSDSNPKATFSYVVEQVNAYPLAYLHIAGMGVDQPGAAGPAFDLNSLRPLWSGKLMVNYGYDQSSAEKVVTEGHADAVAFGKPMIANPDLVARIEQDAPWNVPDSSTFYGGGEHGYTDYPVLYTHSHSAT
ncbi:alkene reductase [Halothiobacillus diazotrophicus]|uniref:Alkene reductase n=1 Tax=Halothiobacillus diazotrophicus TaxID=1860122 RepID=A0A191ZFA8_9GAMM|nr:alkene reductase [Halothiobacillus diazotrophicus]ANJ66545.1 alkene reductase [Halothiobacillus diazotrophicus]